MVQIVKFSQIGLQKTDQLKFKACPNFQIFFWDPSLNLQMWLLLFVLKKNYVQNIFGPKQSIAKKLYVKSVGSKKMLGQKNIRSKKVLVQKSFVPEKRCPKVLGPRYLESAFCFLDFGSGAEIQQFSQFFSTMSTRCHSRVKKMAISQPISQNRKNKERYVFFNFKVLVNKVPLVFSIFASVAEIEPFS